MRKIWLQILITLLYITSLGLLPLAKVIGNKINKLKNDIAKIETLNKLK